MALEQEVRVEINLLLRKCRQAGQDFACVSLSAFRETALPACRWCGNLLIEIRKQVRIIKAKNADIMLSAVANQSGNHVVSSPVDLSSLLTKDSARDFFGRDNEFNKIITSEAWNPEALGHGGAEPLPNR